jgi:uncharacterized protein YrrD
MKNKTRFRLGAEVYSLDDELIGQIDRVVLDPVTRQVTHLIVKTDIHPSEAKVIPVGWVGSVTERDITLYCRAAQLQQAKSSA